MQVTRTLLLLILLSFFATAANAQITQLAELTASDGAAGDMFGSSVAISGNTAVVGAPDAADPYHNEGAAYVFVNSGGGWSQAAKLTASDGFHGDVFGTSVAISADGSTVAIGAPGRELGTGSVYVFVKPALGWVDMAETAELNVAKGQPGLGFGKGVAVNGDGSIVGVSLGFAFARPAGGWVDSTSGIRLYAPAGDFYSIAISGNTLVLVSNLSVAFVYILQPGSDPINPTATLTGLDVCSDYWLAGTINGSTIAVGTGGTLCIFVEPQSGWANMTQKAELGVSTTQNVRLGQSVAIAGDVVLAGAPLTFIGNNRPGAFFAYKEPAGGWVSTNTPNFSRTSSDGASGDLFGDAIAISGNTIVVGAPDHAVNSNSEQGAAYIFGPKP